MIVENIASTDFETAVGIIHELPLHILYPVTSFPMPIAFICPPAVFYIMANDYKKCLFS